METNGPALAGDVDVRIEHAFGCGVVFACGLVASSHGEVRIAADALEAAGLDTMAKVRATGADPGDIERVAPSIKWIRDRRRTSAARAKRTGLLRVAQ